ncbi:MAG: virulence RhuM family protein [Erythrobacter sp.]|nr:virulence RhuM family protein [Erythrobacter sp.]
MANSEPVHLQEDEETGDRFLVYGDGSGLHVEISYAGDQLWMTQAQIAQLFDRERSVITKHIANILEDGELDEDTSVQKLHKSQGRPVALYNLDMVISVGYRVASKQATIFRKWATEKLVQFATKGFVIDQARLKSPEYRDRIAELKEIIRDIRADEANVYRELRAICAMCQDYDGKSDRWQEFYRNTQAKLVFAVCSDTPAGLIKGRASLTEPNMGLRSWPNENIRKADVAVSKNYLGDTEVRELNRLTTMLLDMFEDQMEIGRLTLMSEATTFLDAQLKALGRNVLNHGGTVKMADAKRHAERVYEKFREQQRKLRHEAADKAIAEVKKAHRSLGRKG